MGRMLKGIDGGVAVIGGLGPVGADDVVQTRDCSPPVALGATCTLSSIPRWFLVPSIPRRRAIPPSGPSRSLLLLGGDGTGKGVPMPCRVR